MAVVVTASEPAISSDMNVGVACRLKRQDSPVGVCAAGQCEGSEAGRQQ